MKKYNRLQTVLGVFVSTLFFTAIPWVQAEVIGSSITDFSGVQGGNGWFYGYRSFLTEDASIDYDPIVDFIPFAGGDGLGPWDGTAQQWTGSAWDLNTASAAPWTFMAQTNLHPNGINNGQIHWAIRRWFGEVLFEPTPVAITWSVRKQGSGGNGVTGAIHVNGARVDSVTIAGTDTVGVVRTFYVNADFGTLVDLVLDPRGGNGISNDGSDGSYNFMIIDTDIPEIPRQPDGSVFIPVNAPDTDGDGLPDVWEKAYVGDDLTLLSDTGDYDTDGLLDPEELAKGTDPTNVDTDGDGLEDSVETNTGIFVDATNTGTNPLKADTDGDGRTDGEEVIGPPTSNPLLADTDGDGFSDADEVSTGHDPNDASNNRLTTLIANSTAEFSGVQGQNDWFFGYRNATADGSGQNAYDPVASFIPFAGGEGYGDWDGVNQHWTGSAWDLNTASAGPWTTLGGGNGPDYSHPNGSNSGDVHWSVRRWIANDLTEERALAFRWHIRKQNTGGAAGQGVTGGVFINGQLADSATIERNNSTGVYRTYYANVNPGDIIDLIHSPRNPNGGDTDGSDGSFNYLHVDLVLPANPVQPNGDPFVPVGGSDNDLDGMPDAWEEIYFPGDLTQLTKTGDYDGDGVIDPDEYDRGTNPTLGDTDGDGLSDLVETGTGMFVDASNTGSSPTDTDSDNDGIADGDEVLGSPATDPNKEDTDNDGFLDPVELAAGTDPNDPADNPYSMVIADSVSEFSGVQGANGWYDGYRNYTLDGGGDNYDPNLGFLAYMGGEGLGPWDGITQMWNGSGWGMNASGSGPWTSQSSLDIHPNGVNSPPNEEHWSTRRWVADELTETTPAVVIWRVIKANVNGGSGVTGSLHVNGQKVDAKAINYNDNTNPERRFYVNLQPGDIVDLALTPVGPSGDRGDGADGSQTQFRVDTRIPSEPRQPDGSLFIPANAEDSDGDGLLDFWERIYADDLETLTGTGDNDNDGLDNQAEFERDANPLASDTDGDGLPDIVETGTGTYAGPADTGTKPRTADSDGDGFSDGAEVALGTDPNDPLDNPLIADSRVQFSSTQGLDNWFYGYRDLTMDGGDNNYDPDLQFIPFTSDLFVGDVWDLNPAGGNPWTILGREVSHPNGPNSGGGVHWSVRRWVPSELVTTTPVALHWNVRKDNVGCGNGVTGAIYVNGVETDSATVAWDDGVGVTRTYYVNLNPGDVVDLVGKPDGTYAEPGAGEFQNDWCDGTFSWMQVDTYIPPNPVQPDGTPFVPANTPPTVAISSPADGATFFEGQTVTITAEAADPGGIVVQVEFFAQGVGSLGIDIAPPYEFTVPGAPAGTYILTAVATDNLGASTTSDPVTVTVLANQPPVAADDAYTTLEDTALTVPAPGVLVNDSDVDGDPLTAILESGPASGILTLNGDGSFLYVPVPNFNGTDSFTYKANDGLANSGVATVTIQVLPVNDQPACSGATATACEDHPVSINLLASDPDGDPLTFSVVDAPLNGTVNVTGDVATYQGNLDFSGTDSFTFKAVDPDGAESGACAVSVTVQAGNDTPVPMIAVSPTLDLGPTVPGINVLSPNNIGACVTLDGTQSSDVDNDFSELSFTWIVNSMVVGTGPVLPDVCLLVGENEIRLLVDDGTTEPGLCDETGVGESTEIVLVLSGAEAVEELLLQINDTPIVSRKTKQQFIATTKNAAAALERGSINAGLNMLSALINKFQAQLKDDPEIQDEWIERTQNIIDGLNQPVTCEDCSEAP